MEVVRTTADMRASALRLRSAGKRVGLVPTMGALHEGHLSLMREARKRADAVVVSLFVNPTQFAPHEDFEKYPRDFERDQALCENENVEYLFAPTRDEMYPKDFSTYVVEEKLSSHFEGASRPRFFRGVCTVVAKLFNIVQPHVAIFGQKDAQQAAIIQRMVRDLNFPVEIVVSPIAREKDGLALSSRNVYLSPSERKQAASLHAALQWALESFHEGLAEASELRKGMLKIMLYGPQVKVDYIEFVNPETFERVPHLQKGTLILVAASIGKTRLIDNMVVE